MRLIFFGTSEVAAAHLAAIKERSAHEILALVTKTDKPQGRGQKITPPPAKAAALKLGIDTILQPKTQLNDPEFLKTMQGFMPFLAISVDYGRIFPAELLAIPEEGFLNVHFSLLPRLRGPSPVEGAILCNETRTGVTTFWIDEGMDSGRIFLQEPADIGPEETAPELQQRLNDLGIKLLLSSLEKINNKEITKTPQDHSKATYSKKILKEDGRILWKESADIIVRKIRAYQQWPVCFCVLGGKNIKILKAQALDNDQSKGSLGQITDIVKGKGFKVKCGSGSIVILEVKPEGKKAMPAWNFIQGLKQDILRENIK
ncbi:methionyl-tRNA formyltransferase [Elusimicrobiota bacterium]